MRTGSKDYTLWTKPMDDWTPVLDGVTLTSDIISRMERAVQSMDESTLRRRLRPYDTPVTIEILSQIVE